MDDVRTSLESTFRNALKKNLEEVSPSKILIHSDVGIGKTECLRNIFKYTPEFPLLCFASHALKNEFAETISFPFKKTPDQPKEFIKEYNTLLQKETNSEEVVKILKRKFSSYYTEFANTINYPGVVLTTHDAFLISPGKFPQQTVIFDEIPNHLFSKIITTSLLGIYECLLVVKKTRTLDSNSKHYLILGLKTLIDLIESSQPSSEEEDIYKYISNPINPVYRKLLYTIINQDRFDREFPEIAKVLQFDQLIVNYLSLTVSVHKKINLPEKDKYICFSASPDHELFSSFGFKIERTETPPLLADIIHVDVNTSRQSLAKPDIYKKINKFISDQKIEQIITFKSTDFIIKKNRDIYFGNLEGTNSLLSVNSLGIVGTPMNNVQYFHDLAIKCNKNFSSSAFKMVKKEVDFKQKSVKFQTFSDPWLTSKHIEQMGSEYFQAIGRVRPFNRKSKVYIFSRFPLFSQVSLDL